MNARIRSRIGPKYWSSSSWPLGDGAPNSVRPVRRRSGRCSASRRSTRKYSCSGPMLVNTRGRGRVAEPAQDAQRLLAQRLLRAQQRDLVVERLAGERDERGRDRQGHAVRLDLEEDRPGDVPGGVAAGLERGPDAAGRERAGVGLALHQVLAGELGDRLAVAGRVQERVVLLGRGAGHRHEPVRVVGGAVRHRPLLHAVGDRIDDRRDRTARGRRSSGAASGRSAWRGTRAGPPRGRRTGRRCPRRRPRGSPGSRRPGGRRSPRWRSVVRSWVSCRSPAASRRRHGSSRFVTVAAGRVAVQYPSVRRNLVHRR